MSNPTTAIADFAGLEVVAFESRQAQEMSTLISRFGGRPRVAPSVREVPLEENSAALEFGEKLLRGKIDAVIFMTGVGTRALFDVLAKRVSQDEVVAALAGKTIVARGSKAAKVLRDLQVPITILVPEPNTWREILQVLDGGPVQFSLKGRRVAVQEYGAINDQFIEELRQRGAEVMSVPVYRWTLPDDLVPLQEAIKAIIDGRARVILFSSAIQVEHVMKVATQDGVEERLVAALADCVICSIGPACSEALRAHQLTADLEPEHGKMGMQVYEAALRAGELLERKKQSGRPGAGRASTFSSPPDVTSDAPASRSGAGASAQRHPWDDSPFMKACRREPAGVTPVWLMRQAGRYMKEYNEIRARVPFLALCKNPKLASEVTLLAVERLGVDAAIIFADLLLIAEPLGFALEYEKGEGPLITPEIRQARDVARLKEVEPEDSLGYVYEAIRRTRAGLDPRLPLIGFSGAPFTLASYLIEGGASKNYPNTKGLMYRDPIAWRALMTHLARNLARYVNGQIAAGVQAVQVFDTWVGCLGRADYREFVFPYTRMMMESIDPRTPVIHFGTGTSEILEDMRDAGGKVIGLDFHVELDQAWARLGHGVGVQGNLDPMVLFGDQPFIRERVRRILKQAAGRPGHIFNLGHGILPETPYENVVELVKMVHELSRRDPPKAGN